MRRRLSFVLILVSVFASTGAQYRTQNFVVTAPTDKIAEQIGQYAEHYRREKAVLWLGQEMPPWPQPCPLTVQISMDGPSGATSFHFGQDRILGMKMEIQGPLERLLNSVLPHEITHTVFAFHFRAPVPRWADEGGAVCSEDEIERDRHDVLTRQILNHGQQIPMRKLFNLKDYPRDVMTLYAEGFSMVDFLIKRRDRQTFLAFVGMGMQGNWDQGVQTYYGFRNVEELEEAWLQNLRDSRRQPANVELASKTPTQRPTPAQPTGRASLVRLTVPPAQPLDPAPIVRGQAPTAEQASGQRFGTTPPPPPLPPEYQQPTSGWVPVYPVPPVTVQLGAPQISP